MSRAWLIVALLLSLGINLGLVGTAVARRRALERHWAATSPTHEPVHVPADRPGEREAERPREREGVGAEGRPGELSEEILGARLADRLGLEADRRERFLAAHRGMAAEIGDARSVIRRVREEMRREIGRPSPDRVRLDALLGELASAEVRLNRAFVDGILDARAELDPDESRRLLFLIAELGLGRAAGEPRGMRPGPGPGGPPFGRRMLSERRPLAPEAAPPSTP